MTAPPGAGLGPPAVSALPRASSSCGCPTLTLLMSPDKGNERQASKLDHLSTFVGSAKLLPPPGARAS